MTSVFYKIFDEDQPALGQAQAVRIGRKLLDALRLHARDGCPVGVQLVGPKGGEAAVLAGLGVL